MSALGCTSVSKTSDLEAKNIIHFKLCYQGDIKEVLRLINNRTTSFRLISKFLLFWINKTLT